MGGITDEPWFPLAALAATGLGFGAAGMGPFAGWFPAANAAGSGAAALTGPELFFGTAGGMAPTAGTATAFSAPWTFSDAALASAAGSGLGPVGLEAAQHLPWQGGGFAALGPVGLEAAAANAAPAAIGGGAPSFFNAARMAKLSALGEKMAPLIAMNMLQPSQQQQQQPTPPPPLNTNFGASLNDAGLASVLRLNPGVPVSPAAGRIYPRYA